MHTTAATCKVRTAHTPHDECPGTAPEYPGERIIDMSVKPLFGTLTWDENNQLFIRLHRGYIAACRRLDDLMDAPDDKWRPVMDTAAEMTDLMGDVLASPA